MLLFLSEWENKNDKFIIFILEWVKKILIYFIIYGCVAQVAYIAEKAM